MTLGVFGAGQGLPKAVGGPDVVVGQYGLPKAHEGEVMAVLGLAFLLLVVMPFLIYLSVAWVMRAAKLSRRSE
jgi:hypothetical protein